MNIWLWIFTYGGVSEEDGPLDLGLDERDFTFFNLAAILSGVAPPSEVSPESLNSMYKKKESGD